MSEQKHFSYEAKEPVFIQSSPEDIKILRIRNMIPVEISCTFDGEEQTLNAFVDYREKELRVPGLPQATVDKLKSVFWPSVHESMQLPDDLFAEDRPTVPNPEEYNKGEDIKW